MLEARKIRELSQGLIPEKKIKDVFFIGTLSDNREIWGASGNNNRLFAVVVVKENYEIEVIL